MLILNQSKMKDLFNTKRKIEKRILINQYNIIRATYAQMSCILIACINMYTHVYILHVIMNYRITYK